MRGDEHQGRFDETDDKRASNETDQYQRSSATVLFWSLVAILIILGICVLISLLLVLINGT